jgi:23S rRNA (adenine2503-C2)-methyltransferase
MKDRRGRVELKNLTPEELEAFVISLEEKPFRARQLARWLYGRGARSFGEMTDLAKGFRTKLEESAWIHFLEPEKVETSLDGTKKYRFLLGDGEAILPFHPGRMRSRL